MKVAKSSFAACAVFMAASAFAAATVDENGLTPTLWYQFEGDFASYGSQAVTWNNFATTADYFETINGRRALKYNSKDPYTSKIDDFTPYFGANGFTIATYCRMSSVNKRVTVSFGSLKDAYANHELMLVTANDSTNVRIAYQGADGTKLSPVDGVNPGTRTAFHHYAITCTPNVDESTASVTNWTVALYVDGTKKGSGTIPGVPTKGGIQLFNVFDDSGTGYSGSATGASVDDLRIYDQVLTEEQIQQMNRIAQATRDAQGRYPNVWLSLDGNMDSQGLVTLAWGTGDGITYSDNYIATPTGKALYYWSLTEGKRHDPYTSGANVPEILGESGFTVMTSARMGTGTKNTLFGIGSMTAGSLHELILAQGGTLGQVALVDAVKGAVATVVSTNVSDCARVLHHYAVSVAPGEGGGVCGDAVCRRRPGRNGDAGRSSEWWRLAVLQRLPKRRQRL
ncbi:MAG: LamG-like jellyroll fold domain-containing protein [Kiritimatiellia bacterium]